MLAWEGYNYIAEKYKCVCSRSNIAFVVVVVRSLFGILSIYAASSLGKKYNSSYTYLSSWLIQCVNVCFETMASYMQMTWIGFLELCG